MINLTGKRKPEDGLETEQILKKPKDKSEEEKETTTKEQIELSETNSDEANFISVKDTVEGIDQTPDLVEEAAETVEGGLDETPDFAKERAVPKKTLFVSCLPPETELSDIIDFFKDVGRVVRVRLQLNRKGDYVGNGFVEFASSNQAKKALEKKKGEYFHKCRIFLCVPDKGDRCLPPKYCLDHKVWYEEDYLQQESLPVEEDDAPPDLDTEATVRKRTLFIANLSPQTTKILQIIRFFGDVAEVVSVRLIVNHEGKHVGYGFVEFSSAYEAKKALERKNGKYLHDHKILLMKRLDGTPDYAEARATIRNKTLFIARLSRQTKISDIIIFFKDVGEVVHVRLIVDHTKIKHATFGFVEFASANEAEKAMEKKNREYLLNHEIFLDVVKAAPYPSEIKHCIDHKVWYEDYPQRESLLIEKDAAVEGFDETPDFVKEVASRKKTVFVANLTLKKDTLYITKIIRMFKNVGEVVRIRLIVDHRWENVGCGFVEFSSADEAKKAVQEKNGTEVSVSLAEIAPYPFRLKYNLAEELWYEDNLRRKGFGLPNKLKLEKQQASFCGKKHLASFCGTKITFSDND